MALFMGYELADIFTDHTLAVFGVITAICILCAVLLEKYMPLDSEIPPITRSDENIEKMTREELLALEERDPTLPYMTLDTLKKYDG